MSDFMERAAAASHNPYCTPAGLGSAISRFDEDMRIAFLAGAEWARRELLAEPTEAEMESVARVIYEQTDWSGCEGSRWELVRDREDYYPLARVAIAAFLEARRGSE